MPEVTVRYKNPITGTTANLLAKNLQTIVAEVLHVHGNEHGEISANDIVVRFVQHHPFDIGVMDLEIDIKTVDLPERRKNLQERTEAIAKKVAELKMLKTHYLNKGTHYVWLQLVESGFKTF